MMSVRDILLVAAVFGQLASTANALSTPPLPSQIPPTVAAGLAKRGVSTQTPIQAASFDRALASESLILHAETGSGKSLAFMLPALCRMRELEQPGKLLVLSPTKELCVQLADELTALLADGALDDDADVALLTQGHPTKIDALMASRVIVASPVELCQLLAPAEGDALKLDYKELARSIVEEEEENEGEAPEALEDEAAAAEAAVEDDDDEEQPPHLALAECLARDVATLVLDEVDALVPGRKEFRGKRHWKWLDQGMHPAEGLVKFFARRSARGADFQLLAASATLDQSTRAKLSRQLKPSASLRGAKLAVCSPLGAAAAAAGDADTAGAATEGGEVGGEKGRAVPDRLTVVPSCIEHRTVALAEHGAAATAAALRRCVEGEEAAAEGSEEEGDGNGNGGGGGGGGGGGLVFVSSRSTHLGGAHAVAKELRKLGLEAQPLSDALWPSSSARAIKRLPKAAQAKAKAKAKAAAAAAAAAGGSGFGSAREVATARRAELNALLRSGKAGRKLLVADAAATRGLHLDAVSRVYVLGLPANADAYLHLAGRTGRWPRPPTEEKGAARVVTIASEAELRTLRGWSNGLGGVSFEPLS